MPRFLPAPLCLVVVSPPPINPPGAPIDMSLALFKPPLGYFLAVIASKKWDYLSVLTSGPDEQLNPTYSVIAELNRQGYLGSNAEMHKVGGCRAMLCILRNVEVVHFVPARGFAVISKVSSGSSRNQGNTYI